MQPQAQPFVEFLRDIHPYLEDHSKEERKKKERKKKMKKKERREGREGGRKEEERKKANHSLTPARSFVC
jgi:hypothetical protein